MCLTKAWPDELPILGEKGLQGLKQLGTAHFMPPTMLLLHYGGVIRWYEP